MKKKCIICGYKKITFKVSEPLFRHMDYKKIFNTGRFAKCMGCQVVSNLNKNIKEINKFKTLEYAKSQQTGNYIFEKSKSKQIKKTLIQARLINNNISKKQNGKIFLLCKECFFTTQIIDNLIVMKKEKRIINGNTLVFNCTEPGYQLKWLLRWKNHHGCAGPAWQVKLHKKKS